MITQRAALLGFVGFCFYLIALVNSLPAFYYALTWLAVGLLVSCVGVALLSLVAVKCRWKLIQARSTESLPGADSAGGPSLSFYLENGGSLSKTGLLLEVRLRTQPARGQSEANKVRGQLIVRKILVEALPSGTSLEAMVPLHDLPRGRYKLEDIRLTGSDVLGLFRARRRLSAPAEMAAQEIVVGPALIGVNQASWREHQSGHLPGEIEARYRVGQGDELRGIRPYTPGDDLRQVHWSSTARVGQLVVKEYHHRGRGAALVAWDGALGTDWGLGAAEEWGLRLTASLAKNLSESGTPCTVARLDSQPAFLEGAHRDLLVSGLIDLLSVAQTDRVTDLGGSLARSRGTFEQVFLVTASLSPELSGVVARLHGSRTRVVVGLIDGYSLGVAMGDRRFYSRLLSRTPPQQFVEPPPGSAAGRSQIAVTEAAYREQAERLSRAGARVVMVSPGGDEPKNFLVPLFRALNKMVAAGESPVFVGGSSIDV